MSTSRVPDQGVSTLVIRRRRPALGRTQACVRTGGRFERPRLFCRRIRHRGLRTARSGGPHEPRGSRAADGPGIPCGWADGVLCGIRQGSGGNGTRRRTQTRRRRPFARSSPGCNGNARRSSQAIETCTDFYFDDVSQIRMAFSPSVECADASDWSATAALPSSLAERRRRSRIARLHSSPASPKKADGDHRAAFAPSIKRCFTPSWQRATSGRAVRRPVSSRQGRASACRRNLVTRAISIRSSAHWALGRLPCTSSNLPDSMKADRHSF